MPKGDIRRVHSITSEQARRDGEPERLRGLEVITNSNWAAVHSLQIQVELFRYLVDIGIVELFENTGGAVVFEGNNAFFGARARTRIGA